MAFLRKSRHTKQQVWLSIIVGLVIDLIYGEHTCLSVLLSDRFGDDEFL